MPLFRSIIATIPLGATSRKPNKEDISRLTRPNLFEVGAAPAAGALTAGAGSAHAGQVDRAPVLLTDQQFPHDGHSRSRLRRSGYA